MDITVQFANCTVMILPYSLQIHEYPWHPNFFKDKIHFKIFIDTYLVLANPKNKDFSSEFATYLVKFHKFTKTVV